MRKAFTGSKKNDEINGTRKDDDISGGKGNDKLFGNIGDDKISGDSGDDALYGGAGHDVLSGGSGSDLFYFRSKLEADADVVKDFEVNRERLCLDREVFDAYVGPISDSTFVLGTVAADEDDFLIYDQSTGKLYYDEDGSGEIDQVLIMTLANKADISFADMWIGNIH